MYKTALIIPTYKATTTITKVINNFIEIVDHIYVVEDACPENSSNAINFTSDKLSIIKLKKNLGVGGATKIGFQQAINDNFDILIKVDSDNQMSPEFLSDLLNPLINEKYDYAKGNRFFPSSSILSMPKTRLIGNSLLSFIIKFASGQWQLLDPTNGYFAIKSELIKKINLEQISNDYFFECDLIINASLFNNKIINVNMPPIYNGEISSLNIKKIIFTFPPRLLRGYLKRLFYNYLLKDFNIGSLFLILGFALSLFGLVFGIIHWMISILYGHLTSSGTVMLAALPFILGTQFLINFLIFDVDSNTKSK